MNDSMKKRGIRGGMLEAKGLQKSAKVGRGLAKKVSEFEE